ncbi:DUF2085 domain-containing protein [Candidatus Bathyarchaeota archaeon]|nr:DUF2085 domain-containing protein [Candidatus Bathyarchaeota archaeon]
MNSIGNQTLVIVSFIILIALRITTMEIDTGEGKRRFTLWNVYFVPFYFLNAIAISNHVNGVIDTINGLFPFLLGFQCVIVSILARENDLIHSLASLLISEALFVIYQLFSGIFIKDPTNFLFLIFLIHAVLLNTVSSLVSSKIGKIAGSLSSHIFGTINVIIFFLVHLITSFLPFLAPPFVFVVLLALLVPILVLDLLHHVIFKKRRVVYTPALTHHIDEDADHTIPATFGNVTVYFCTRCAGMILGVLLTIHFFTTFSVEISGFLALVLDIFIPLPIFIDWGTQRFGFRQSTTISRLITGGLTGTGFYILTYATLEYPIASSIVLASYLVALFLIYIISTWIVPRTMEDLDELEDLENI